MSPRLDRAAMQLLRSVEMRVEGGRDATDQKLLQELLALISAR
jgi:hypothetical protein